MSFTVRRNGEQDRLFACRGVLDEKEVVSKSCWFVHTAVSFFFCQLQSCGFLWFASVSFCVVSWIATNNSACCC